MNLTFSEKALRGLKIGRRISLILAVNFLVAIFFLCLTWYGMQEVGKQFGRTAELQNLNAGVNRIHSQYLQILLGIRQYLQTFDLDRIDDIHLTVTRLEDSIESMIPLEQDLREDLSSLQKLVRGLLSSFREVLDLNLSLRQTYYDATNEAQNINGLISIIRSSARDQGHTVLIPPLERVAVRFQDASTAMNKLFLTGKGETGIQSELATIEKAFPVLEKLVGNDLQLEAMRKVTNNLARFRQAIAEMNRAITGRERLITHEIDGQQQQMDRIIEHILSLNAQREKHTFEAFSGGLRRTGLVFLVLASLFLCIGGLLTWTIGRSITKPLSMLSRAILQQAEGKHEHELPHDKGDDEIAIMTRAVRSVLILQEEQDRLIEKLRESRDETQRSMEALEKAKESAEAANRAKSRFLANMSHEIRTPMNGVLGMTELLLAENLSDEQRRMAETVFLSARSLMQILNDILDFSKIEAGKVAVDSVSFDLRELVEEAVGLFAEHAQRKGLELLCLIGSEIPACLEGDPTKIRQILVNLIGNAVKFTDKGEVAVRAIVVEKEAGALIAGFEVKDTGIGIPFNAQEQIFDSFSQADDSTTRRYGGTGLGLSICRHLAQIMGGSIHVVSLPGSGSTFVFRVPLKISEPASARDSQAYSGPLRNRRILIVDDNESNRLILRQQVECWGTSAMCADSGPAALEMLRQAFVQGTPFDIAILDMMMPGMDGLELVRRIRQEPDVSDVKLIVLTGWYGDISGIEKTGISAFLTKPIRMSQLYNALVETLCDRIPEPMPLSGESTRPGKIVQFDGGDVLLVEDNLINQAVAEKMLISLGLNVDTVSTGKEAVEAFPAKSYRLILMDCQLPEMDGFEATRKIREWERSNPPDGRHIPIIAVTAHAMTPDREICLSAGMDDYLSKPFDRGQLCRMLARWLSATEKTCTMDSISCELRNGAGSIEKSAPPAFDVDAVLDKLGGDRQLFAKLTTRFFEQFPDTASIKKDMETGLRKEALKRIHSLKGAAGALAANGIFQTAQKLESEILNGTENGLDTLLSELDNELKRALAFIQTQDPAMVDASTAATDTLSEI